MGTNYYLQQKPCEHCGRTDDRMHIGKSSGGWVFAWRGYETVLTSPSQWENYLQARIGDGSEIRDEYGKEWSLDDLLAKVRAKREGGRRDTSYASQVEGDDLIYEEFS